MPRPLDNRTAASTRTYRHICTIERAYRQWSISPFILPDMDAIA
jgi:hypothetical protein